MGWDIHVACEYKDINGNWVPGDDYCVYYDINGSTSIEVTEPIAQFRNYNLFRPLANVRNTQQCIDREIEMMEEYAQQHRRDAYAYGLKYYNDLYPESKNPTAVVDAVKCTDLDSVTDVSRAVVYNHSDPEEVYIVDLDTLTKFCNIHFELHQLRAFRDKANDKWSRANEQYMNSQQDVSNAIPLSKKDFRIVYGFDY